MPDFAQTIPPQAECKFEGELFNVYQWPQKMFDGSTATFEMLRRSDTVETIGIKGDKIVVTRQTQPHQSWFYAYPGGRADAEDADELAAAKREMLEETGMKFANWKLIDVHQPIGKIDWLVYTFLATDLIDEELQTLDAGEKIEVLEVSFEELKKYAKLPNAKFLEPDYMKSVHSLDELKNMPALFRYE